jgi:hypothetical protein
MKNIDEILGEINEILKENNCHILSQMSVQDDEDFPYLVRRVSGTLIEARKIE